MGVVDQDVIQDKIIDVKWVIQYEKPSGSDMISATLTYSLLDPHILEFQRDLIDNLVDIQTI